MKWEKAKKAPSNVIKMSEKQLRVAGNLKTLSTVILDTVIRA